MVIESISGRPLNPASAKTNSSTPSNTGVTGEQKEDQVKITSVTQEIKKELESTSSEPIVNQERIDALRESIKNGNYEIDAGKIAQKILQFEP